jgi:hypothetical protein
MGFPLPRAPGSVGRQPCGQDPPLVGQMGQDNIEKDKDKVVDEGEDEDDDDADVDEDLGRTSSDRWVPRSGPPVCVFCAPGSFGPVAPLFPLAGCCVGVSWAPALVAGIT